MLVVHVDFAGPFSPLLYALDFMVFHKIQNTSPCMCVRVSVHR